MRSWDEMGYQVGAYGPLAWAVLGHSFGVCVKTSFGMSFRAERGISL
jgi:hypothetical protein